MTVQEAIDRANQLGNVVHPGWRVFRVTNALNGLVLEGAVFNPVTRGPRKGEPNYRSQVEGTLDTVVIEMSNESATNS